MRHDLGHVKKLPVEQTPSQLRASAIEDEDPAAPSVKLGSLGYASLE